MTAKGECVHATAISAGGRAALIRGTPGIGKSDLALRCLSLAPTALIPHPAMLVSDDQVRLHTHEGKLFASAPAKLKGLLEVRGLGITRVATVAFAEVALIADLIQNEDIDRMPDTWPVADILGHQFPVLRLKPFEASAPIKLLLALCSPELPPSSNLT